MARTIVRTIRKDLGKARIIAGVRRGNGVSVKAGIFPGSHAGGDSHPESRGETIAGIGTILHFGPVGKAGKKWPWMSQAFRKNLRKYIRMTEVEFGKFLAGKIRITGVFSKLGVVMSSDQVKQLNATRKPALEDSTKQRKKSSKPLRDKGTLRNAHAFEIED